MALNINRGCVSRPVKAVIYGPEGIGKSTLASKFPDPVFLDTEGGTAQLDVSRIDGFQTWGELVGSVGEIALTPNVCKTVVLDTADWAEQLAMDAICHTYKQQSIESFGYGKGYTYLMEEWGRLLKALDGVWQAGMHVCIVAHAKMRKQELPDEAGAFDRWEMKLTKQVAPLVKEWADMLLFLNYKTYVTTTDTGSKKATGGKRVMYATHNPCWDAKNRYGLPDEMDLGFEPIAKAFETFQPVERMKAADLEAIRRMAADNGITEAELKIVCVAKKPALKGVPLEDYDLEFLTGWVIPNFGRIAKLILERRN